MALVALHPDQEFVGRPLATIRDAPAAHVTLRVKSAAFGGVRGRPRRPAPA
ncbi:hypothetical protein Ae168Ps1_5565 [Pseudonocardia sp. Ae168_Ps1]|nr:hypothetical protein Ae168Ps1_5565 [Pseudonocardia sp. Ae168_Ps1]